jgi:NAD(P)-dependent dehydrogenase (short-subunit alcohol dehydrogenase family)
MLRIANFDLRGRTALVTGAGRGMGEAFARILSLNGAHVAVCDLDRSAAVRVSDRINESGGTATAHEVDVADPSRVERLVAELLEVRRKIDVLVNNAGVLRPTEFSKVSEAEWQMIMRVNVDGVFYCCRYVAPSMIQNRYGKIVNISSTAGKTSSTFGGVHYTASKTAVLGITRHLARELAPYHINVNAVCPGSIDTPMLGENASEERIESAVQKIPWGRLGTPEEVANLVLFLASDASSYITGASVDINGGELTV